MQEAAQALAMNSAPGMLLCETRVDAVPLHVRQLLEQLTAESGDMTEQKNILFMLVYLVAMEAGFLSLAVYQKLQDELELVPLISTYEAHNLRRITLERPSYKRSVHNLQFSMPLFTLVESCVSAEQGDGGELRQDEPLHTLLTAVVYGDLMVLTLTPPSILGISGYSTALRVGRYVLSSESASIFQRLHNLHELSRKLRDELFVPMRNMQLQFLGVLINASYLGMPEQVHELIFGYLTPRDISAVSQVSRRLRSVVRCSRYNPTRW